MIIKNLRYSLVLLLLPVPGIAQQKLDLQQAINIALKNSLDLQMVKNDLQASTINNNYGVAGGLPLIQATGTDNAQNINVNQKLSSGTVIKRNGSSSNTLNTGLGASVLVYNGRRIVANKKRLATLEQMSRTDLDSMIINVVANVQLTYYDIVRQQSYAATLQKSIDVSQQKLDIVKAKREVGMSNDADLFQAQVDINTQQQALQSQLLVISQDKTALLRLLTLKADSVIQVSDTIIVDTKLNLDTVLNSLLLRNPRMLAADLQIKVNELTERQTAAQRYPSLSVNAGYDYNRTEAGAGNVLFNQNNGPYVGAGLTIPIFNGTIYKRQQQVARIATYNAKIEKDIFTRNYTANTVKLWQAYTVNLQQVTTAVSNYDLSYRLLNLVLQRFQLGQATIIDVKTAQQSFENSGYLLVNLTYAAKAAEIQLKSLANLLDY
ncbi:outer membrane protein TolC [Chitinophaga niastensis]|uniref:Outer membrane protein TolC n=1 Tax=Chitinophaga niastensis TaxID=536980 RepID=A0A2P8HUT0_CHINA|nr:TolC family protein [Chitinophaga niastensis]PSL49987.1 outer membrane protein TolC [Chitinophaga niastensis]